MRAEKEDDDKLEAAIAWFLDSLYGERGASAHTVSAYERDLRQIAEFLRSKGARTWGELDAAKSAALRAALSRRGLAATSIARKLAALRSLLKFLAMRGEYNAVKLPELGGIRRPQALPKALSQDEVAALLDEPDVGRPAGLRNRAMLELLYGTGMRVSELVELTATSYQADESLLRVTGKRGKVRVIPIPARTHDWLRRYLQDSRPSLAAKSKTGLQPQLFLNQRGTKLSRSGVFLILSGIARRSGMLSELSPHTLRHTYAVHLVKAGADLRAVQELLGHASVATTEVYTHLDMETVKRKYRGAHPRAAARRPT